MSNQKTLTAYLIEFSSATRTLINEIAGQKQRFEGLINDVATTYENVKQALSGAIAAKDEAGRYAESSNQATELAERYKNEAGEFNRLAGSSSSSASTSAAKAGDHKDEAGWYSENCKSDASKAAQSEQQAERAKDEAYLAVAGLAADIAELKTSIIKKDGIA